MSCGARAGTDIARATVAASPSREPASLTELPWERQVVDGLRDAGIAVTLVGGSKFESGEITYADGSREMIDRGSLIAAPEGALRVLWLAILAVALSGLAARWL